MADSGSSSRDEALGLRDSLDPSADGRLVHVRRVEDHDRLAPAEPMRDVRPVAFDLSGLPGPAITIDGVDTPAKSVFLGPPTYHGQFCPRRQAKD